MSDELRRIFDYELDFVLNTAEAMLVWLERNGGGFACDGTEPRPFLSTRHAPAA
ncbi:hypothetical protein [Nocardia sp. NPDC050793]|uniref:hypothetical protein n=1 Tax=Nocardia sp. NPDC050793 TaxID=3155159 RepID=UPI0033D8E076